MEDMEDEETQIGQRPWLPSSRVIGRARGLLPAGLWPQVVKLSWEVKG